MAEETDREQLITHLRDAHALEEQAIKQLERACQLSPDEELRQIYQEHLQQSHEHQEQVGKRIEAHDEEPSAVRDLTMRSGAVGLRQLADVPPDTPVKLAMHFFAFENLEIAIYSMLCELAKHAGDDESADTAQKILEQEREAAEKVQGTFDRALELTLESERKSAQEREESSDEEESPKQEESSGEEEPSGAREPAEAQDPSGSDEPREREPSRSGG